MHHRSVGCGGIRFESRRVRRSTRDSTNRSDRNDNSDLYATRMCPGDVPGHRSEQCASLTSTNVYYEHKELCRVVVTQYVSHVRHLTPPTLPCPADGTMSSVRVSLRVRGETAREDRLLCVCFTFCLVSLMRSTRLESRRHARPHNGSWTKNNASVYTARSCLIFTFNWTSVNKRIFACPSRSPFFAAAHVAVVRRGRDG